MSEEKKKFKLFEWAKKHAPKALDLAGNITGIDALNNLADIIKGENPDNLTPEQIQQALQQRQLDMQELELYLQDVANARNREIEISRTGKKDIMMFIVGSVILLLLIFATISVFFFKLENESLSHLVLGELLVMAGLLVGYYFGTSKSSNDKTNILARK